MHAPQGIPYFYWYLHAITLLNSITVQFLYGSTGTLLVWSTSYYKFVRHETAYFCELQWQRQHSETSSDYRCGNALTGGNISNAHGKTLVYKLVPQQSLATVTISKMPSSATSARRSVTRTTIRYVYAKPEQWKSVHRQLSPGRVQPI